MPPMMTTTTTKHAATCNMAFGRKDASCPRCRELLAGAAPREGWGSRAKRDAEQTREAIRAHDCKRSHCGPVCTAFDW